MPRSMGNNEPRTRPVCLPNNRRRGENKAKQSAIVSSRERLSRRKEGGKSAPTGDVSISGVAESLDRVGEACLWSLDISLID